MSETKATSCPNCGKPAMKTGNEITCENCDATFVISKKQEAEVKNVGTIADHEDRIKKLESASTTIEPKEKETETDDYI